VPAVALTLESAVAPPLTVTEDLILGHSSASGSSSSSSGGGTGLSSVLGRLFRPRLTIDVPGLWSRSFAPYGSPGNWQFRAALVVAGLVLVLVLAVVGAVRVVRLLAR
jgi:hypothetical protein